MVRLEVGLTIFGVAMLAETYFKVAFRSLSLGILEAMVLGVPLGYVLGVAGLLMAAVVIISRQATRNP